MAGPARGAVRAYGLDIERARTVRFRARPRAYAPRRAPRRKESSTQGRLADSPIRAHRCQAEMARGDGVRRRTRKLSIHFELFCSQYAGGRACREGGAMLGSKHQTDDVDRRRRRKAPGRRDTRVRRIPGLRLSRQLGRGRTAGARFDRVDTQAGNLELANAKPVRDLAPDSHGCRCGNDGLGRLLAVSAQPTKTIASTFSP